MWRIAHADVADAADAAPAPADAAPMTTRRLTATFAALAATAATAAVAAVPAAQPAQPAAPAAAHYLRLAGHTGRGPYPEAAGAITGTDVVYPKSLLKSGSCPITHLMTTVPSA
jgi:hypothetical protein